MENRERDREEREDLEGEEGKKAEHSSGKESSSESDLKEREYTDEEGNVHHHSRSYMEEQDSDE